MRRARCAMMAVLLLSAVQAHADTPFSAEYPIYPGYGVSSVAVADFDNDGQPDLACTTCMSDTVMVWQSSDPGTYLPIITGYEEAWSLAAGDINGDGDVDLVAGKLGPSTNNDVTWFENPGVAGNPWTYHAVSGNTFSEVRSVKLADMNRDGALDILLTGVYAGDDFVSWFRNGDGLGTDWILSDVAWAIDGKRDAEAADLDGDGDLDIVATCYDSDEVIWIERLSAGWDLHVIRTSLDGAESVGVGDIDEDGDPDVVVGAYLADEVRWFENRLDEGLSWIDHIVETGFDGVTSARPADVDLDGDLDIVATASIEGTVAWFENTNAWPRHDLAQSFLGARSAVAVDRDLDGDLDVVAGAMDDNLVSWWENLSNRMAPEFSGYYSVLYGANAMSVEMADMDRDGRSEVIIGAHNATGDADVIVAMWDSGFVAHPIDTDLAGVRTVRIADLNGDSWPDIVAAAQTDGLIRWYRNNGNGISYAELPVATFAGARGLAVGDLDCDGDLDVVATSPTSDEVSCWFNNGDGTSFSAEQVIASGLVSDPATVRLADMNQDGDLDVVFGGMDGTIMYRNNNSCSGTSWSSVVVAHDFDNTTEVDVGDADGDGWQDILVASSNTDTISVLLHEGGASWVEHPLSLLGTWTAPMAARFGDLDNDGDLDVIAADHAADEITWFKNNGAGTFTRMPQIHELDGAVALALGDWDLDGRLDVTFAGEVADSVRLRANIGGQFSVGNFVTAPPEIADGDRAVFFTVMASHADGRSGDLDIELRRMYLKLEETPGVPLTSAQANAIFDRVEVWAEIAGAGFDPDDDQLVFIDFSLALDANGYQELSIIHGNPRVGPFDLQTYYIVLEMTDDASATASQVVVTHRLRSSSMMWYWDHQYTPLRSPPWAAAVATVSIVQPMFADDFESGSTSAWSSAVP